MKEGKITVELVDKMGSDLDVVNAARVSFNKEAKWEQEPNKPNIISPIDYQPVNRILSEKDSKLIHYLASHNHWSPFGHCIAKFRIKAPIFVARQLVKHQIGLTWNEVSRRYVDDEPEFYMPEVWRGKPVNKKQGSSQDEITDFIFTDGCSANITDNFRGILIHSILFYNSLIESGVAPEQARMVLPQNMMTTWIWTGSLYAWSRVANLRIKDDAQEETRETVHGINQHMVELFPVSWKELVPNWFYYAPSETRKNKQEQKGV